MKYLAVAYFCLFLMVFSTGCTLFESAEFKTTLNVIHDIGDAVQWLEHVADEESPEQLAKAFVDASEWISTREYIPSDVKKAFAKIAYNAEASSYLVIQIKSLPNTIEAKDVFRIILETSLRFKL